MTASTCLAPGILGRLALLALLIVAGPSAARPAQACRPLSRTDAFKYADTVLVAYVSGVRIPALEAASRADLYPNNVMLGYRMTSPRRVRLVVLRQAKGPRSAHVRHIRVTFCHGILVEPGERVIAYHFGDGVWRLDAAPKLTRYRNLHLPPLLPLPSDDASTDASP